VASSLLAAGLHRALRFRRIIVNTKMIKTTGSVNRPRGRPSKHPQDRLFQMRVSEQFLRMVDDWRRGQTDLPSRAEAIRRLVELATQIKKKPDTDR
jgi:hypothetical protein